MLRMSLRQCCCGLNVRTLTSGENDVQSLPEGEGQEPVVVKNAESAEFGPLCCGVP